MSDELTREALLTAIDELADETLDDAEPPFDALLLAQRLGVALKPQPGATAHRRQSAAAQVIGAHLKPLLLRRLGVEGKLGVSVADLLAARLLVPTPWLASEARAHGFDLLALGEVFSTASHELIAWRLLDLDDPCVISLIDGGRVEKRRGNATRPPRDLTPAEEACWRRVAETNQPQTVREGAWSVTGWPLPERGRLILRAVGDGEE